MNISDLMGFQGFFRHRCSLPSCVACMPLAPLTRPFLNSRRPDAFASPRNSDPGTYVDSATYVNPCKCRQPHDALCLSPQDIASPNDHTYVHKLLQPCVSPQSPTAGTALQLSRSDVTTILSAFVKSTRRWRLFWTTWTMPAAQKDDLAGFDM